MSEADPVTLPRAAQTDAVTDAPAAKPSGLARTRKLLLMFSLPVLLAAGGLWWWMGSGTSVSTDNAYVQQDVVSISPEVGGTIVEVAVRENQRVRAGELLFRVDPELFRIALAQADADIAAAEARVTTLSVTADSMSADINTARNGVRFAEANMAREQALMQRGFNTRARMLIASGFGIAALSLWMMSGWSLETDARAIVMAGLVQGLGMGLCFMPLNVLAFSTVPADSRTDGASLLNLARSLGASLGISLITTLLARNLQISHADLVQHLTPNTIPGVDLSATQRLGPYGDTALVGIDAMVNRQAAMIAYLDDFWLMAIIVAAFVPIVLLARG
jgi:hypothetical protein